MLQEAIGPQIEAAYKNTSLKQERGKQIEAIKVEAHRMFDSASEQGVPLLKSAVNVVAASLGGLGGLGASTSKPDGSPESIDEQGTKEFVDDTLSANLAKSATDFLPEATKREAGNAQQDDQVNQMPSVPPPDDAEASTSGRSEAESEQEAGATALQVSRAIKVSPVQHAYCFCTSSCVSRQTLTTGHYQLPALHNLSMFYPQLSYFELSYTLL